MTRRHVLVVDDDPQILEIAARALTAADLRVSTARRVSVARDILARQTIDLVLTDARIPGETGLALAETTRALGIATIVMSGNPEWAADHGLTPGHYLAKPFELVGLVALVRLRIREGDAPREAEPPEIVVACRAR